MSHNAYVRGGVGSHLWDASTVLASEFERFDAAQFKSVNGDDGGTWAPTSPIVIGGSGMTIDGAGLILPTTATVLYCQTTGVFTGLVQLNGSVQIGGAGTVTCAAQATFNNILTASTDLICNGTISAYSAINITGTNGKITEKLADSPSLNADGVILNPNTARIWRIPALSNSRQWILPTSGSFSIARGDVIEVTGCGSTFNGHSVFIYNGAVGPFPLVDINDGINATQWASFVYTGTEWIIKNRGT